MRQTFSFIDTQQDRRLKIIEAVKRRRGERKVLNCSTFKTEGSKSAIITAGRGLGLDSDITQYLSNLIPVTRGQTWSLHDCLYGNEEKERQRQTEFANEVKKYDKLLETAMTIEGLICGRSIHASAVYLFNEDFLAHNARMKAPNGIYITQFNMKDSDYCSGLKMDFLTIQALDKIRTCMNLLIDAGYMKWQGSLRATYNKYLHPDVLDYDTGTKVIFIGDVGQLESMDKRDKHEYLLGFSTVGEVVFDSKKVALNKVHEAEKHKLNISDETDYEEY